MKNISSSFDTDNWDFEMEEGVTYVSPVAYDDEDECDDENIPEQNVASMFDYKLNKKDLVGALDQMIVDCDKASKLSKDAISSLEKNKKKMNKLAKDALDKYPLL